MLTDNGTHYLGVLYDIKRFRRDCCVYWALLQTQSSVLDGRPTVHHTPGESQQRLGAVPRTTAASVSPTYGTSLKDKSIGDRKGGGTYPLEFKKDDVICCSPRKYPKIFARTFVARNQLS